MQHNHSSVQARLMWHVAAADLEWHVRTWQVGHPSAAIIQPFSSNWPIVAPWTAAAAS
jgi:hypothetical protein